MNSEEYISELITSTLKVWLNVSGAANCVGTTIKWLAYSVRPGVKEFRNYKTEDIVYGKTSHTIEEWISILNHYYSVLSMIFNNPTSCIFFQNGRDNILKLIAKYIKRIERMKKE
ncbi:coiled coils domain protein [Pacmanvirus S19]|nr:coiled coils domain protein [Pacmanvirus S19]